MSQPESAMVAPALASGLAVRRRRWKHAIALGCVSFSLANLVLVNAWFATLFDKDQGYFNKLRVENSTLLALLTNLAGLSLVFWVLARIWSVTRRPWVKWGIELVFLGLMIVPLDFVRRDVLKIADYQLAGFFRHPVVIGMSCLVLALSVWQHRKLVRLTADLVVILTPLAVGTTGHALLLLVGLTHLSQYDARPPLAPMLPARPELPRVVWIIFDEMDYRLAFEQRPAGLKLPEFDRLSSEGLQATQAFPPGGTTLISMPALITGQRLSGVEVDGPSTLMLEPTEGGARGDWKSFPSVFSRARALGANAAVVGWYHPYRRVLASSLASCSWYPIPASEPALATGYRPALAAQLETVFAVNRLRRLFIDLCQRASAESVALAGDPRFAVMLFHLSPPHKPGVYLPETDTYTTMGMPKVRGYFNSLVLADRMLGRIRRSVNEHGLGERTWFIVSSDHWWRESKLFDGKQDQRVPFLVKAPQDANARTVNEIITTELTHDLVLSILQGEVRTLAEVEAWLLRRPPMKPPDYASQRTGVR